MQVVLSAIHDAFYRLTDSRSQIQSYVFDVVRANKPKPCLAALRYFLLAPPENMPDMAETPAVCTSLQVRATVPKMILDDVFTVSGTVAGRFLVISALVMSSPLLSWLSSTQAAPTVISRWLGSRDHQWGGRQTFLLPAVQGGNCTGCQGAAGEEHDSLWLLYHPDAGELPRAV